MTVVRDKTCPKCGNKTLDVVENKNGIKGACRSCNYCFEEDKKPEPVRKTQQERRPDFISHCLKAFNRYSGVISVIAVVLAVTALSFIGPQIDTVNTRITGMETVLDTNINVNRDEITSTNTVVNQHTTTISDVSTRLGTTEAFISGLGDIQSVIATNMNAIDTKLNDMNNTIINLSDQIDALDIDTTVKDTTDINATFTFYVNQSNTTSLRYCHLEISVDNTVVVLKEVVFGFRYDYVNISLLSSIHKIKPQEYQWTNGAYSDNYLLTWFEKTGNVYAKFNLTWDISKYNTTNLPTTGIENNLKVNSVFLDIPEIYEKAIV